MAGRTRISIVGAGKVGTTLAVLLHRSGHRIVSVVSKKPSSAKKLAALVACKTSSNRLSDLSPTSDFILIAAPDESISGIARKISLIDRLSFERLHVAHTSGVISSEALQPVAKKGAQVFSFHPIQTFPSRLDLESQLRSMAGISYGVEGKPGTRQFAKRVVRALKGRVLLVPKEEKILYHIACVLASNYAVSLLGAVENLIESFVGSRPLQHFEKLIHSSVRNAARFGAERSLTGPVARGSLETIAMHTRELSKRKRDLIPLYRELGLYALRLAMRGKRISAGQARQIRRILEEVR